MKGRLLFFKCHIVPLYWREGRCFSKAEQFQPKRSRQITTSTDTRRNMYVWFWGNCPLKSRPTYMWATDTTVLSFDWVMRQVLVSRHFRNISRARADPSSVCHSVIVSHFGFHTVISQKKIPIFDSFLQDCGGKQTVLPAGMLLWYIFTELFIVAELYFDY